MPAWAVAAGAIVVVVAAAVLAIGGAMAAWIGRAMDECGPSPLQDEEPRP